MEADAWRAEVLAAIGDAVRPALAGLRDALRDELLPSARADEHAGMCHLPGGEEAYAALVWASTSTNLTPAAVHEIGLEQLARLDDEYSSLGRGVLGIDDPVQLRERLRDDPTLRYATAQEIAADVTAVLAARSGGGAEVVHEAAAGAVHGPRRRHWSAGVLHGPFARRQP